MGKAFKSRTKVKKAFDRVLAVWLSAQVLLTPHLLTSGEVKGMKGDCKKTLKGFFQGEIPVFYENIKLPEPSKYLQLHILKVRVGTVTRQSGSLAPAKALGLIPSNTSFMCVSV